MALSANEQQDQNRSEVPAQTVTNTFFGNLINKCCSTNRALTLPKWTTLNEFYGPLAAQSIGTKQGRSFELKYFGIGVRGANAIGIDARGVTKMRANQHQPSDANLFTAIPFLCRELAFDLPDLERKKYRMRTVQKIGAIDYVFYWLKLIDFADYNPQVNKITRDENGQEIPVPYVPIKDDLFNPQPVEFTSEGSTPISNVYGNSSAILNCSLYEQDLVEISNACRIMFNDAGYGAINEVCVVWGVDTQADGQVTGGAVVRYTEVQSAVIGHFVTERDARNALTNTKVQLAYDHGASEPMLLHTNSTTSATSQGN